MTNIEHEIATVEAKSRRRMHITLAAMLTILLFLANIAMFLACFVLPKLKKIWSYTGRALTPTEQVLLRVSGVVQVTPGLFFLILGALVGSITYLVLAARRPRQPRRGFEVVIQKPGGPAQR
jgi:type II secretory pathway component PulF